MGQKANEQDTIKISTSCQPVSWRSLLSWLPEAVLQLAGFNLSTFRKAAAGPAIFAVLMLLSIVWAVVGMLVLLVTFVFNLTSSGSIPCMLFISSRLWTTVAILLAIEQNESIPTGVDIPTTIYPNRVGILDGVWSS